MTVPALALPTAHAHGPAHRQTGSRKKEQEAAHTAGPDRGEQTEGPGGTDGPSLTETLTEMQKGRSEKKKKLIDKKKLQIRLCADIWKLFAFFDL